MTHEIYQKVGLGHIHGVSVGHAVGIARNRILRWLDGPEKERIPSSTCNAGMGARAYALWAGIPAPIVSHAVHENQTASSVRTRTKNERPSDAHCRRLDGIAWGLQSCATVP